MIDTKTVVKITLFAVLSEVIHQISLRIYKKLKIKPGRLTSDLIQCYGSKNKSAVFHKVLFFPDSGISCRTTLSGRMCRKQNCSAVHDETSLSVLINVLKLAQQNLDVCVYMITCSILGDALIDTQKRGLVIRIITEERNSGEEGEITGSQIAKLRSAGIKIRCSSTSFWMHHKFLIADNEVLVNGSFNWTNQAVMGNYENLIITSENCIVQPFISEFQRLWDKHAPVDCIDKE